MLHELVPLPDPAVKIEFVDARQGADIEHELVAPRRTVLEGKVGSSVTPKSQLSREPRKGDQRPEGAVMVPVVPDEHIGGRSLRGGSLERGVCVDHAHGRFPAGIGNAPLPDAPVVVRDVRKQPRNGVVGVAAFIHVVRTRLVGIVSPDQFELAVGLIAPPHILEYKDVPVAVEQLRRPEPLVIFLRTVGRDGVRRTLEQDGVGSGRIFGRVDDRELLRSVAHGNSVLSLAVVILEAEVPSPSGGAGSQAQCKCEQQDRDRI